MYNMSSRSKVWYSHIIDSNNNNNNPQQIEGVLQLFSPYLTSSAPASHSHTHLRIIIIHTAVVRIKYVLRCEITLCAATKSNFCQVSYIGLGIYIGERDGLNLFFVFPREEHIVCTVHTVDLLRSSSAKSSRLCECARWLRETDRERTITLRISRIYIGLHKYLSTIT